MVYIIDKKNDGCVAEFKIKIPIVELERLLRYYNIPVSPQAINGVMRYLEAEFGMAIDYVVGEPQDIDDERLRFYVKEEGGEVD